MKSVFASLLFASSIAGLTACGGGESSNILKADNKKSVSYSESLCGGTTVVSVSGDILLTASSVTGIFKTPGTGVAMELATSGGTVCVTGNLTSLTMDAQGTAVYVSGNVESIDIEGSGNYVYIWGDVSNGVLSGVGSSVYAGSFGTVTNTSVSNSLLSIADFKE
jgi:hypothetical protein